MELNEMLVQRIRRVLEGRRGISEKKMFGGVAFMVRGNMACGPWGDDLIVRIGEENASRAIGQKYVREMAITGRVMSTFAHVEAPAIRSDAGLRKWVEMAADYAGSLPAKRATPKAKGEASKSAKKSARRRP